MTAFKQIQPVSLRELVVEQVRKAIIEGHLKPNDHIVEATLTQQLGVSRTPVREALILLEREGLVVTSRNRGSFVRAYNEKDIEAIFTMRTTLENFAGELIIDKMTPEDHEKLDRFIQEQENYIRKGSFKDVRTIDMSFHQTIINYSEHYLLIKSWSEIVAQIAALLYIRAEAIPTYDEYHAIRDHRSIVDAFKAHDLNRLRAENKRINDRVCSECLFAIKSLNGSG